MHIITKLYGGLGNQMFQFSAGYFLSNKLKKKLYLDISFYDNKNCDRKYQLNLFENFRKLKIPEVKLTKNDIENYQVIGDYFSLSQIIKDKNIYMDGHFQNKSFVNSEVLNIFKQDKFLTSNALELSKNIRDNDVCLNIRRTDYVIENSIGFLPVEYQLAGLKKIKNYNNVYVMSDDPEWCKKNFKKDYIIIDHSYTDKNFYDYLKLKKHFNKLVIPNSTFDWWAAIDVTYTQKQYDIVCPDWTIWFRKNPQKSIPLMIDEWKKVKYNDIKSLI